MSESRTCTYCWIKIKSKRNMHRSFESCRCQISKPLEVTWKTCTRQGCNTSWDVLSHAAYVSDNTHLTLWLVDLFLSEISENEQFLDSFQRLASVHDGQFFGWFICFGKFIDVRNEMVEQNWKLVNLQSSRQT